MLILFRNKNSFILVERKILLQIDILSFKEDQDHVV